MALVKYLLMPYDLSSVAINSSDQTVSEQTPVPVLSREQFCSHSNVGIAGSNPAEGMDIRPLFVACCVGSGVCDGLITRPEESYRVCVCVCVCVCGI